MITEESSLVEVEVEFFLELFSDVFGVVFRETSDRDPELTCRLSSKCMLLLVPM